jgi:hypothetical protein
MQVRSRPLNFLRPASYCSVGRNPSASSIHTAGPTCTRRPSRRPARGLSGLCAHGQESRPPLPVFLGVHAVHDKSCALFSCAASNPACALTPPPPCITSPLPWSAAPPSEPGAALVARRCAVPGRCQAMPTPPGASTSRAAPHQPLPAARGASECRHPWRT